MSFPVLTMVGQCNPCYLESITIPWRRSTRGMDSKVPNPYRLYPLVLFVHWLALTDGQSTRGSVELLSYPPVGPSLTSTNVVLMSGSATVGHSKVPKTKDQAVLLGIVPLPSFVENIVVATSEWIKATAPSPPDKTR